MGGIIGFSVSFILTGRFTGEQGIAKSIVFTIGNYDIHIHHWIMALTLFLVIFFLHKALKQTSNPKINKTVKYFEKYNGFIYGYLFGWFLQGLTYNDFYRVVYTA